MDLLGRPRSDVLAVTMPCFGTTRRTRSNAELLCHQLGVSFACVDISESVRRHLADIGHSEQQQDVTYENAQARERTQVLMDIANRENGLVVGTGDLLSLHWAGLPITATICPCMASTHLSPKHWYAIWYDMRPIRLVPNSYPPYSTIF